MLSKFFKAGIGGAASQVLTLLSLSALARLYDKEHFAVWGMVLATASIISSLACLRYELAIVIPKEEKEASVLFSFCAGMTVIFSGLVFGVLLILPDTRHFLSGGFDDVFTSLLYMLPLIVFFTGLNLVFRYWNTRKKNYILISVAQLMLAIGTIGTQIGYATVEPDKPLGLVLGLLVGQVLAVLTIWIGGKVLKTNPHIQAHPFVYFSAVIKKHYRFLYFSTPFTVFSTLRDHATPLILNSFMLASQVGTYSFVYRILRAPVALISSAVRPVMFQATAEMGVKNSEGKINELLEMVTLAMVPLLILYSFYYDLIFTIVFGNKWQNGGELGLFFIWPVFTFMLCNWMDRILDVLNQQKLALKLEIVFSSASLLGLWVGLAIFEDWYIALGIQSAVLTIYNITYLLVAYRVSTFALTPLYKLLLKSLALAAICTVVILCLGQITNSILVLILYCFIIYAVMGIWLLKRRKK